MQDVAVIPLVLLLTVLSGGGSFAETALETVRTLVLGAGLIGVFMLLVRYAVPWLFKIRGWARNRELPILLAIVTAIGSAVAAHEVSISPAIGAFVAGVLLGESPFAVQIRADVGSLRILFVTLFFASVGMVGEPAWVLRHWHLVAAVVSAIIVGKALIIFAIARLLRVNAAFSRATGLCLAQVGEFSFVLAEIGRGRLIDEELFRLIVSSTILTLFLTPFLVALAPRAADWIGGLRSRRGVAGSLGGTGGGAGGGADTESPPPEGDATGAPRRPDLFVVGFGPAGEQAAQSLRKRHADRLVVIELNPEYATLAERLGLRVQVGNATNRDVLEHVRIQHARVILVTVSDPYASRAIIHHCRYLAPQATIVARARYHVHRWELQLAGAMEVVDEEQHVGKRLAKAARKYVAD